METNKLTGQALDWAVGTAMKLPPPYWADGKCTNFSTDWAQGGPIIERELINITHDDVWTAEDVYGETQWGDTALQAAMRCYVASKLGDEVEIPEELTK